MLVESLSGVLLLGLLGILVLWALAVTLVLFRFSARLTTTQDTVSAICSLPDGPVNLTRTVVAPSVDHQTLPELPPGVVSAGGQP